MKQLNLNSRRLRNSSEKSKKLLLKRKRNIYKFPPYDKKRYARIIEDVFNSNDFKRQLEETKLKLPDYDNDLIEDVIKYTIRKLSEEIQVIRPWKRRIFIHAWGYIEIFPKCFNPYSMYYNHNLTMKRLKRYEKEILKIKNKQL